MMNLDPHHPRLCLSLTETSLDATRAAIERMEAGVDMVEISADRFATEELARLGGLTRASELPAILSLRRQAEGAVAGVERLAALRRALEGRWSFVDLDEELHLPDLEEELRRRGIGIIRSLYDFDGVPGDLAARLQSLPRRGDEVARAVVTPRSTEELLTLLEATSEGRPAIIVARGDWGVPARVLPGRFSSPIAYCTAGSPDHPEPGEIDPATARRIYRLGEVSAAPEIYCVIGNPVLHSRSPWIHNPALRAIDRDAVYVPVPVDELSAFFRLAERLPIAGASVTVPHKEGVRAYLSEVDESVAQTGACNTLVRRPEGWAGFNTDVEGFLVPLRERLPTGLVDAEVLVIGAGGAARAAVYGLVRAGARVTIVNRTDRRAAELASQFGCRSRPVEEVERSHPGSYQIVVQATSVGMAPHADRDPLPGLRFEGSETVYEMIYAPAWTPFLQRAEAAGCTTIPGREMLLNQAYTQFRLFTGQGYPAGLAAEPF